MVEAYVFDSRLEPCQFVKPLSAVVGEKGTRSITISYTKPVKLGVKILPERQSRTCVIASNYIPLIFYHLLKQIVEKLLVRAACIVFAE